MLKKQLNLLYSSSIVGSLCLTGAWVAILSARGFSLMKIGLTETIFHIVSLIFELPSGVLADVFGRKRMLIVSTVMSMIGNVIMVFSRSLVSVCISVVFTAVSYNFASGSDSALAYDSMKLAGQENQFGRYESNQMLIYRVCSGLSTLCAGFALQLGYRLAYSIDAATRLVQILILAGLREVSFREEPLRASIWSRLGECIRGSLAFLKAGVKPAVLMFANSLVGAVDILLLFYLQAKLPIRGIPDVWLGFSLLFMEIGGIVGARLILRAGKWSYVRVFVVGAALVVMGLLAEHAPDWRIMTLGGFLAAVGDDWLQVRTNALLQGMFPSEQRATLTSVESFTFSVVMVVLTPLAGILFTYW